MTTTGNSKGIWIASLLWLISIAAALFAAAMRQLDIATLVPLAAVAAVPAIGSLFLAPFQRKEWAQILIIFLWIALAIIACLAFKFIPMGILFLCAPAMAALFEKEKVVEAMVLASIAAGGLYYFTIRGDIVSSVVSDAAQSQWGTMTGIAGTIFLLIGALYGVSASKPAIDETSEINVLEAVPGGLLRVSDDNVISAETSVAAAQFGLTDELEGLDFADLFSDSDKQDELETLVEKARASGRKISRKFRLKNTAGKMRPAEITAGPLSNGDVMLHVYDTSAHEARLRTLHSAYETAQKDADGRSLFFAGVSHELRTPLNAIIGFSDMMRSRLFGPLPGKYAEYADLIHDSGQHMLDLIGDVLDLSKVEAGKYELIYHNFDAADVIRSSAKMLRPAADNAEIRLDVEILSENGELLVEADRKALRQIILNLLSNAIKFSPKGGRVLVRGDIEKNFLKLGVVDNGAGMTAEELETIGQPFKQTETGQTSQVRGSGLGLSLVKSLASLHEGRFEITSKKDVGTTADVYIPLDRA